MTEIGHPAFCESAGLTPREAAELLHLSPRQVRRLANPGGPLVTIRRHPIILFTRESVEALAASRQAAS